MEYCQYGFWYMASPFEALEKKIQIHQKMVRSSRKLHKYWMNSSVVDNAKARLRDTSSDGTTGRLGLGFVIMAR